MSGARGAVPERVLQFGTGRFLLGFLGDFVDRANRSGELGAVVVVQSTGSDRARLINDQHGRYTLVVRGMSDGRHVDEQRVLSHVSRALGAETDWPAVLAVARDPALEIVVSNTTEVGLTLDLEDPRDTPRTFPAKLAAILAERFAAGRDGLVVLPCELVEANGTLLRSHVLALTAAWGVGPGFALWLDERCSFPNTLVDRIVTGLPSERDLDVIRQRSGFEDRLATVAEPYALWVIEGAPDLARRIWFASANPSMVVAPDISKHRELKVRLLNGGHSACAALAILSGFRTVYEAVSDPHAGLFIEAVLRREIGPTLPYDHDEVDRYIDAVLNRWRNPFLEHAWRDIAMQYTAKLRPRLVPTIERSAALGLVPAGLALGFAAYLRFLRQTRPEEADLAARPIVEAWSAVGAEPRPDELAALARGALARSELWGTDLSRFKGFADAVASALVTADERGFRELLVANADIASASA